MDIRVRGRVQGVFFRDTARRRAEKLGISGFVRNEPDGSLYIEAEGEDEELDEFAKWCREGPALAKVYGIDMSEGAVQKFEGFEVRHG